MQFKLCLQVISLMKSYLFLREVLNSSRHLRFNYFFSSIIVIKVMSSFGNIFCTFIFVKVKDNPSGDFKSMHRHISKGSWTFSDQDHGWQVSDCTAEGLKVKTLNNFK